MKITLIIIVSLCFTHLLKSQTIKNKIVNDSIVVNTQIAIEDQDNPGTNEAKPSPTVQTDNSEIIDITKNDNSPNGVIINQLNVTSENHSDNVELKISSEIPVIEESAIDSVKIEKK